MTDSESGLAERAAELRSAFDHAFAAPLRLDAAVKLDLLAIRVGAEPFAIRLSEVVGLFAGRKITRVPGRSAALLGIAGFRGALVPVYSLRLLLPAPAAGQGGQSATRVPRWLAIASAATVALAFDAFDGHLRASADAILPQHAQARICGYAPEFIRAGDVVRPILHLPSVIAALGTTERPEFAAKEE